MTVCVAAASYHAGYGLEPELRVVLSDICEVAGDESSCEPSHVESLTSRRRSCRRVKFDVDETLTVSVNLHVKYLTVLGTLVANVLVDLVPHLLVARHLRGVEHVLEGDARGRGGGGGVIPAAVFGWPLVVIDATAARVWISISTASTATATASSTDDASATPADADASVPAALHLSSGVASTRRGRRRVRR